MITRLGLLMMATVSRRTPSALAAAEPGSGSNKNAKKKPVGSNLGSRKGNSSLAIADQRPSSNQAPAKPGRKPIHKVNFSSSASNVNPKRNVLQKALGTSSVAGLNKAFDKLSVKNERKLSSSSKRSSAVSSARGSVRSLEDVARLILNGRSKKIVVMAGAGISTPSGIPDFRTPGSGLYDNLQQYKIPYPEAIFDIMYFYNNPKPFFALAQELYPGNYRPNYVHYFVKMLQEKGLLLRMYTQNIDGLERLAGLPAEKLVEAHGTFSKASCIRCQQTHEGEEIKDVIVDGRIPKCKRQGCSGVVKPDIVFFGEDLPKRFFYYLKDFPQCDLLIIMGTSLEVYPFAGIVDSTRMYIPRLLINREAVGPFAEPKSGRPQDIAVTGDLVENVQRLTRVLGWKKAMEDMIKENEAFLDVTLGPTQNSNNSSSKLAVENTSEENRTLGKNKRSENNQNNIPGYTGLNRAKSEPPGSRSFHVDTVRKPEMKRTIVESVVPLGTANRSKSLHSVVRNTGHNLPTVGHILPTVGRTRKAAGQWDHRSEQTSSSSSDESDTSSGESDSSDS